MKRHVICLGIAMEPGRKADGWRVTLDGKAVGPWLIDQNTAEVVRDWLNLSLEDLNDAMRARRIEITFLQAMGLGEESPLQLENQPTDDQPKAIEQRDADPMPALMPSEEAPSP